MNKEDEDNLLRWLRDKDVSEVMNLLMRHGNRYSRRILKFFRWFCKYVPIIIMCFHAYGMWDFSKHPGEIFITNNEHFPCYLFIYFMIYILPMVLILASRFSSIYVGDTEYHSSISSASMLLTSLNGVGTQLKI